MVEISPSFKTPLSERELDELGDLLDAIPGAMSIEMMEGFLTALICSPDMVMPSAYLHYICGEDHEFKTAEQASRYASLVLRHWNSIVGQLENNDTFHPVLLEYEDGFKGNEWAEGFLSGTRLGGEGWEDLINDDEKSDMLVPIFVLAHEHDPDPELRPYPIDPEKREKILAFLIVSIPLIYAHFASQRAQNAAKAASLRGEAGTFQRSAPKTGRNEPCPCGSNLKYKKCCGKN